LLTGHLAHEPGFSSGQLLLQQPQALFGSCRISCLGGLRCRQLLL
jgi:hypothetical protein